MHAANIIQYHHNGNFLGTSEFIHRFAVQFFHCQFSHDAKIMDYFMVKSHGWKALVGMPANIYSEDATQ